MICSLLCFNPHTHAGCDLGELWKEVPMVVSIHTPTQGVTRKPLTKRTIPFLFQSTHPRRVWPGNWCLAGRIECFNPHTHAGCDSCHNSNNALHYVSIHTPTQGVTVVNLLPLLAYQFQSTHPRRVWRIMFILKKGIEYVSIHTPTQGVTWSLLAVLPLLRFQSTHPRRVWLCVCVCVCVVSIHTPTQGVTASMAQARASMMFQSTHPRRVWLYI